MEKVIAKQLPDSDSLIVDPKDYYRQVLHGYYNFDCFVKEGVTRTAKFYIPEGTVYNQPTIFITIPGGEDTYVFLVKSGWKQMADEKKFHIVMMEPKDGKWGDPEEEAEYFTALNTDVSFRPFFCAFPGNFYGFGYGEAADILAHQARRFVRCWAALGLIGSNGMSEDEAKLLGSMETRVPGVMASQVQMPVWIVSDEDTEALERELLYYKNADHSCGEPRKADGALIWNPEKGGTVDEHYCAKVVFDKKDWKDCLGYDYCERIYNEICAGVYRYPGYANGALRKNADIRERGFKLYTADVAGGYNEDGSDTYRRLWWVYVPETADQSKPMPAVFVFHGAGGSADEIADRSGWAYVAEKYGFLIICPQASVPNRKRIVSDMVTNEMFRAMWNTGAAQEKRPDDLLFVDYLYKWLPEHYNVDMSRVYASGQSSGGMMSWACAALRPDYFAATAPVSAKDIDIETGKPRPYVESSIIPVMANLGLMDNGFKGGFGDEKGKALADHWIETYHLTPSWDGYTYNDGGNNCSYKKDEFANFIFRTKAGVPLLRLVENDYKTHAIMPSECEMAWTEWFTKFTKDPDTKELYYEGEKVEI